MLDPMVVPLTSSAMRLRLQAPAIVNGTYSGTVKTMPFNRGWVVESGDFSAEVIVTVHENDYITLEGFISNHGTDTREVRFTYPPLFYHFHEAGFARIFNPTFGGILEPKKTPFALSYPGPGSFCLTGATSPGAAVGMGIFNKEQRHVHISHVPSVQDGAIRFYLNQVEVKSGETFVLPQAYIKTGQHWGEAFAPYRDYISTYTRIQETPDWFIHGGFVGTRHAHCVAPFYPPDYVTGLWSFDNEGRKRNLDELKLEVDLACDEAAKRGLIPLFYQFGWWKTMAEIKGLYMFDSVCGDYMEANSLIKEIVKYIHSRRARTYLYTNAISFGEDSEVFAERSGLMVRDRGGMAVSNGYFPMYMLCPTAPGIREYWDQVLQCILIELDADGIFLDQIAGGTSPLFCYDPNHRHDHPDTYGAGIIEMIKYITIRAREIKPDALISGELCHDVRSIYLDETHGRGYVTPDHTIPETEDGIKQTEPAEYYSFMKFLSPLSRSVSTTMDLVMDGSPGQPDQEFYTAHRELFDVGFVPCQTQYPGVIAYLFGSQNSQAAVLAVRCYTELKDVTIYLPRPLQLVETKGAASGLISQSVIVDVGSEPKYYLLKSY